MEVHRRASHGVSSADPFDMPSVRNDRPAYPPRMPSPFWKGLAVSLGGTAAFLALCLAVGFGLALVP